MWTRSFPIFLFLIPFLLPGAVACTRQDVCEEKMLVLEGTYSIISRPDLLPEEDLYTARVSKSGDQWVFSFSIPVTSDNGRRTPQLFEQRVRWSPEIKTYLFEHLSDSDYKRMKTDFIVTRYSNRGWITLSMKKRSETETMVIDQFTWDRQR